MLKIDIVFSENIYGILSKGDVGMIQTLELTVGGRYEVQPKDFHRSFIGTIKEINGTMISVEIETYDRCDEQKMTANKIIEVESLDIKKALDTSYFFS